MKYFMSLLLVLVITISQPAESREVLTDVRLAEPLAKCEHSWNKQKVGESFLGASKADLNSPRLNPCLCMYEGYRLDGIGYKFDDSKMRVFSNELMIIENYLAVEMNKTFPAEIIDWLDSEVLVDELSWKTLNEAYAEYYATCSDDTAYKAQLKEANAIAIKRLEAAELAEFCHRSPEDPQCN